MKSVILSLTSLLNTLKKSNYIYYFQAVNEGDFVKVCEVAIPTKDPELSGKVISLNVDMQTFSLIRNKISQIGISN